MRNCGHMHTSPDTYTLQWGPPARTRVADLVGVTDHARGLLPRHYLIRTLPIVARAAVLNAIGTMQDRYSGARAQGKAPVLGTSVSVLQY